MTTNRRWHLNEAEGRFGATNISESVITVDNGLNRLSGDRIPVGRYRLDLGDLARRGFVTEREVGGSVALDVQIYRLLGGEYVLGVRVGETTPLAEYGV